VAVSKTFYLDEKGALTTAQPAKSGFDEYVSDRNRPVPYMSRIVMGMQADYMTDDQRFAAARPDVLVYKTPPLTHDVTVYGPISVDLKVSTSGTDSDFDVKLIDVYPGDYPDATPVTVPMGGYQQLVRGEPFRGKFRKGFEKPVPFEPGKPDRITFKMPDVAHTFREGHRIMVQIQISWLPLTDRNPQKFMDIPRALFEDFVNATERVFTGGAEGSRVSVLVAE
jgi:hypothetical protein